MYPSSIPNGASAIAAMGTTFILLALVIIFVALVFGAVVYILQSMSMYAIAKRRGIQNPWLAWVPYGNQWILGCISDQYQYVAKGRVKNKRKWLLICQIGTSVIGSVAAVIEVVIGIVGMATDGSAAALIPVVYVLSGLLTCAAGIALTVLSLMALYDLYQSCDPDNSILYLIVGIFVNIAQTIFMFICRNKDLGMPPRRPEPAAYAPQQPAQPEAPWQEPEEFPESPEE